MLPLRAGARATSRVLALPAPPELSDFLLPLSFLLPFISEKAERYQRDSETYLPGLTAEWGSFWNLWLSRDRWDGHVGEMDGTRIGLSCPRVTPVCRPTPSPSG